MKKILLFAACLISMVGNAVAQEIVFETYGDYAPGKIASKNKDKIEFYTNESNDENHIITIYNDQFKEIKKLTLQTNKTKHISSIIINQEREQSGTKVFVAYTDYIWDCYDDYFYSINDARESIRLIGLVETTTVEKGDSIFFYFKSHTASSIPVDSEYYYEYEKYGTKYPMRYWLAVKESDSYRLHHVARHYEELPEYNGAWRTVDIDTTYGYFNSFDNIVTIRDYNYPIGALSKETTNAFSNDIFDNNSETYEYAVPHYVLEETNDTINEDYYWDAPRRRIMKRYNKEIDYTYIYSEDKIISTIKGNLYSVMLVNNETYLSTDEVGIDIDGDGYNDYKHTVYRYNPATTSAEAIHEYTSRSKVNMNDNIVNIELQQASNSDSELVLTSAAGKVYKRKHIAAGTKNVQIDMRNMPRGVYNISLLKKGKAIESSKVMKH
ncbi:MAG: hypothetical protein IKD38_00215 [Bacteroidaceae bacterium]|nr:hypothetical protein [Bacteroidaceae bacterium]